MSKSQGYITDTRIATTIDVEKSLKATHNLTNIQPDILIKHPSVLPILRMSTCPPIARDRLIGLAGVSKNLVMSMETLQRVPPSMKKEELIKQLSMIGAVIDTMADPDIFVWKERGDLGTKEEVYRASTIVADRLCGAIADPIIRNAQEQRQLKAIKIWLEAHGYRELKLDDCKDFLQMPAGTFTFRLNVPIKLEDGTQINIPIDAVVMLIKSKKGNFPLFFEAKSAGDYTNTNKRRKEEAIKIQQLRRTYGSLVSFNLFLCGYFDSGYLGYEAAEGIDWAWEHRIDDLEKFGI